LEIKNLATSSLSEKKIIHKNAVLGLLSIPDPAASRLRKACAKVPCLSTSGKKSQNPKSDPTLKLAGSDTIGTVGNQKSYRDSSRCAAHIHIR
jgi:hypothetical protein